MKRKLLQYFTDYQIKSINFDSRKIKEGDAFFAIKSDYADGNDYIDQAFASGAKVVFTDNPAKANTYMEDNKNISKVSKRPIIYFKDNRKAIGIAAGIIYPDLPKHLIGITGTNGKSSVVSFMHQILSLVGKNSAALGTIGIEATKQLSPELITAASDSLTTKDPINFRKILHLLTKEDIQYTIFEASSHGLKQRRLGDVKLNTAAFVSFSQDHLEYHKTMQSYLEAKLILFAEYMLNDAEVVLNSDMMFIDFVTKFLIERNIKYSTIGSNGDLKIISCRQSLSDQEIIFKFKGKKYQFNTDIIGSFQASNILIAAKLVCNLGFSFADILPTLSKLKPVIGRLQRITKPDHPFQIFVDFAHTPDALEKTLTELNKVKEESGKLVVIFGCGGDRDKTKRIIMGEVADKLADIIIVTDDNPRTENPASIRADILKGTRHATEIASREEAIIKSIAKLQKNDILVITGKGHENYMIIGDQKINFSDAAIASKAINS